MNNAKGGVKLRRECVALNAIKQKEDDSILIRPPQKQAGGGVVGFSLVGVAEVF